MKPRTVELGRFARDSLTASGTIERKTGETIGNAGEVIDQFTTVYEGPCLVYALNLASRTVLVAEAWNDVSHYAVTLPAGTDVTINDRFTATDSPLAPDLIGVQLNITDAPLNAWQVAMTCTAERIQ